MVSRLASLCTHMCWYYTTVDEGCIGSVYTSASDEFAAEMSGKYFDKKAKMKKPNPASKDQDILESLEQWTKEVAMKGGVVMIVYYF